MKGRILPIGLRNPQKTKEGGIMPLEAFKVHNINTYSVKKTADGYCYFPEDHYSSQATENINQEDFIEKDTYENDHFYVPVVSFDGYNVLMLDQVVGKGKEAFAKIEATGNKKEGYNHDVTHWMDAYSLDDVDVRELTPKGLIQYRSALVASERFDALVLLDK